MIEVHIRHEDTSGNISKNSHHKKKRTGVSTLEQVKNVSKKEDKCFKCLKATV